VRIAVVGAGLVGRRTAEHLAALGFDTVLVSRRRPIEPWPDAPANLEFRSGWIGATEVGADLVVLATASQDQPALARRSVGAGVHVVCTADGLDHIDRIRALDRPAAAAGVSVIVGAAYSPGVSTVLALHLAADMSDISTITTAQFGTGGPACARQHHRAMGASGREVHEGRLRTSRGGSGRELVWFPEPVGPADCYRAGLAEPALLQPRFPRVDRIESRQAATRRDRLTSSLPMLRRPHAEGLLGAVWVEVRGRVDGRVEHRTMAATGPQATGAAAMAAACCRAVAGRNAPNGVGAWSEAGFIPGVTSTAKIENPVPFLKFLSTTLRLWTYDGSQLDREAADSPVIHAAQKWKFPLENPAVATNLLYRGAATGSFA